MGVAIGPWGISLLVLDVERPRKERQHLSWGHQSAAAPGVVPIKKFEPRVLDRISLDVASVGSSLPPRRPPATHADPALSPRMGGDALGVLDHDRHGWRGAAELEARILPTLRPAISGR